MKAVAYKTGKNGTEFIRYAHVPANHTEEAKLGAVDITIIVFVLLTLASLIGFVLAV